MHEEHNSIMAVFSAIADGGELSRAQISDVTGFSLMTVGKAVELLEYSGIITQTKRSSGSAGRKMSVCGLDKSCGMIIYDLSGNTHRIRITDLSLAVCGEYTSDTGDVGELTAAGFGYFMDILGGELAGLGCVVPDGTVNEYAERFRNSLGHAPELIIEDTRAHAAANAHRLDTYGAAVLLRLHSDGRVTGALTYRGRLYAGAHGKAGRFSSVISTREEFAPVTGALCALTDPETVHISCDVDDECEKIAAELYTALSKYGITGVDAPHIIAEPTEICRSASDGAALLLREKYILSKIPNNT